MQSDSTMQSNGAARSTVLPCENRKVAKTNTERRMLQRAVMCAGKEEFTRGWNGALLCEQWVTQCCSHQKSTKAEEQLCCGLRLQPFKADSAGVVGHKVSAVVTV